VILILCPNLCLDRVIVVRGFEAGRIHRAETGTVLASGKGLNVARAARALGEAVTVVGLVGDDDNGHAIIRGARSHGIALRAVRVHGPARICTLIIDPGTAETVINETGPATGEGLGERLLGSMRPALRRARILVLAGSLPAALPGDFYARAIAASRNGRRIPAMLDAAGEALRRGLEAKPDLVKVNRAEMAEVAGRPLASVDDVLAAAGVLGAQTGGQVIVTMGSAGAALVSAGGRWHLRPPDVPRVNTIGAGDSMTAGIAVSLLRGQSLLDAVRVGVAAAAADVTTLLPGTVEAAHVEALISQVTVETLGPAG